MGPGLFSGGMYGPVSCRECHSINTSHYDMFNALLTFSCSCDFDSRCRSEKFPSMKDLSGQLNCNNNNNNNRLVEDRNVCVCVLFCGGRDRTRLDCVHLFESWICSCISLGVLPGHLKMLLRCFWFKTLA